MLPEIVNKRRLKGQKIGEPEYILTAKKALESKKVLAKLENENKNGLFLSAEKSSELLETQNIDRSKRQRTDTAYDSYNNEYSIENKSDPPYDLTRNEIGTNPRKRACTDKRRIDVEYNNVSDPQDTDSCKNDDVISISSTESAHEHMDAVFLREMHLNLLRNNILPNNSQLSDDSVDAFLQVIRANTAFVTNTIFCQQQKNKVRTISEKEKCIQIIGGEDVAIDGSKAKWNIQDSGGIGHYRCLYFDGSKIVIYDSMFGIGLCDREVNFINRFFPKLTKYSFAKMRIVQKDSVVCGVLAAAFATSLAMGEDPSKILYPVDKDGTKRLRETLFRIIETNILEQFPRLPAD